MWKERHKKLGRARTLVETFHLTTRRFVSKTKEQHKPGQFKPFCIVHERRAKGMETAAGPQQVSDQIYGLINVADIQARGHSTLATGRASKQRSTIFSTSWSAQVS